MIFITHAEQDEPTALALANLLFECIEMPADAVSLDGPPIDGDYPEICSRLRENIGGCSAVIALVPSDAPSNSMVLFELGAAWAMDKLLFLIFMPGIDFRDMPGLLSNYPCVDIGAKDAHITVIDMARDIADFLGLPEKKNGNTLGAIETMLSTTRNSVRPASSSHFTVTVSPPPPPTPPVKPRPEPDRPRAPLTPTPRGTQGTKATDSAHCEIVCCYDVQTAAGISKRQTVIRASWDELFKSFAPQLDRPQDDDIISKLILEFCKAKNPTFYQNCLCGMFRKPSLDPASYSRIMRHFAGEGVIGTARAPHSSFRQEARRQYWMLTESGQERLRHTLLTSKALQEWQYSEKHVQRSAVRKIDPRDV